MKIQRLRLSGFRNIENADLALSPGVNLLVGENGAGKTALLEALYLVARGRSFRTNKTRSVIGHDDDALVVRVDGEQGTSLAIRKTRQGATELKVDGHSERKLSRLADRLPVQLFLPELSSLVYGGPKERRHYLDWGLFHVKHTYPALLRDYTRNLRQRNAWLRQQGQQVGESMDPWLAALAALAEQIDEERLWYVEQISRLLPSELERVGREFGEISVQYYPGWDRAKAAHGLENLLGENLPSEVKSGVTQRGPHRADLRLLVDGNSAAETLSRGQAKILASALLLAQARLLLSHKNATSLFLVDDIGSELDRDHNRRLFGCLSELNAQVVATTTDRTVAEGIEVEMFHVKHGQINAMSAGLET